MCYFFYVWVPAEKILHVLLYEGVGVNLTTISNIQAIYFLLIGVNQIVFFGFFAKDVEGHRHISKKVGLSIFLVFNDIFYNIAIINFR